jgi:hypothetical protein
MSPANTPPAFRPVIRVVGTKGGIHAGDYCARLARAFVPHLDNAGIALRVAGMQGAPVPVAEHAQIRASVPAAVVTRLQALADQARATAEATFASVPDALVKSILTVVDKEGAGFPVGTVVWLRYGAQADLQFIFPQLVADVATANFEQRAPVADAAASRPKHAETADSAREGVSYILMADVTVKGVAESAVEVASSVSWALPPPWNVGITAGLSLLQMLMKATDQPDGPSPMEQLKDSLEDYLKTRDTDKIADNVRLFNENLLLKTEGFTFAPDQLTVVGSGAEGEFDDWWKGYTGIDALAKTVNSAISNLERAAKLDDGTDSLKVACAGVTAWTTGMKVSMQLKACKLTGQLNANDASGFADGTASWRTFLEQIHDRLFDMPGLDPGTPAVQGWSSRIEQWIDKMRTARLAQLHVVRTSYSISSLSGEDVITTEHWGWRFYDDADNETDHTTWKHFFEDTYEQIDKCHSKTVEHKDDADSAMKRATTVIDGQTKDATDALSALRSKVTDIANLQPPKPPKDKLPTVALMTSGTATPNGLWKKGAKVIYQIAFVNDNGPSDPGPPTPTLDIGDFAGATLTDIPQDANADAIQIVRTIVDDGSNKAVRIVGSVQKGTLSFQDVRFA